MRFVILQQVAGPRWMVYDTASFRVVGVYQEGSPKVDATEIAGYLNRGYEHATATQIEDAATLHHVRSDVRSSAKRRANLQPNLQSEEV